MRRPRSRVRTLLIAVIMGIRTRTLLIAVALAAVLLMGARAYVYYRLATIYGTYEIWLHEGARTPQSFEAVGGPEAIKYCETLAREYRRAMWCPWLSVTPPARPHAKGHAMYTYPRHMKTSRR
jgi:hypothetical protein